jgi:hypothetical protein
VTEILRRRDTPSCGEEVAIDKNLFADPKNYNEAQEDPNRLLMIPLV